MTIKKETINRERASKTKQKINFPLVNGEGAGAKHSQRVDSLAQRDIGRSAKVAFNTDGTAVCSSCNGKSIAQQVGIDCSNIPQTLSILYIFVSNTLKKKKTNGNRKDFQTLGTLETTLLYILHWIILDAADECADSDNNEVALPFHYNFSVPTMTVHFFLLKTTKKNYNFI